jgi:hypothetical protein
MAYEADLIPILCAALLGGSPEVVHPYQVGYDLHRIRIDCETAEHVIEVGLDKRSSLDSVQQALFAAAMTGKAARVVLIDTDGREGRFEYRIKTAAQAAGVAYSAIPVDTLIRHQMTSYLRERRIRPEGS